VRQLLVGIGRGLVSPPGAAAGAGFAPPV